MDIQIEVKNPSSSFKKKEKEVAKKANVRKGSVEKSGEKKVVERRSSESVEGTSSEKVNEERRPRRYLKRCARVKPK